MRGAIAIRRGSVPIKTTPTDSRTSRSVSWCLQLCDKTLRTTAQRHRGDEMTQHTVATREEWLAGRRELLEREKELTRRSDELARQRQELPWVPVDEEYVFDTDEGPKTLAELFDGRSQLIVYHFMHCLLYTSDAADDLLCVD